MAERSHLSSQTHGEISSRLRDESGAYLSDPMMKMK